MKRNFLVWLFVLTLFTGQAAIAAEGDQATWTGHRITSDGSIVLDSGIGITMGGEKKTSWGSIISPMTDVSGYTYPTDSAGNLKLHDDGDITLGGGVATDVAITFDDNSQDFYVAKDDDASQLVVGAGSTVGTDNRLAVTYSLTETRVTVGDGVNEENKGIVFDGNAGDFWMGYTDAAGGSTNDTLAVGAGSDVGAQVAFYIDQAVSPKLNLAHGIDAIGAVDMDYGSSDVTDHTFTTDNGSLVIDGGITLPNSESIVNSTDGTVRVSADSASTILEVWTPNDTAGTATLRLSADLGDAAGENYDIEASGTDLLIQNDTASLGTPATILTVAKTGIVTTTSYINQVINDANNTSVADVAKVSHTTSGTAAAGMGTGLVYIAEDAGGTAQQSGSIDMVYTAATDGAESADIVMSQIAAGTERESLRLTGATSTTVATQLQYKSTTSETDGIVDVMAIKLDSVQGPAANFGAGISFQVEASGQGGPGERASLDVQLTTATESAEMADVIINQMVGGTTMETLKLVAASSATAANYMQFTGGSSETNGVTDLLVLNGITSGTATTGLGTGIVVKAEDASGNAQQIYSIDGVYTAATNAAESADIVFSQIAAGTERESLRLTGATSATVATKQRYTSTTGETDGIVDVMEVRLNSVNGPTTNFGEGISFQVEATGQGGPGERASMDIQLTTATESSEDADIILSQMQTGVTRETLRLVGDTSTTACSKIQYTSTTAETDASMDTLVLKLDSVNSPIEGFGQGISWQIDDRGGVEEQASIDIMLTATEDSLECADIYINQNVLGTMTNVAYFDASRNGGLSYRGLTKIVTTDDTLTTAESGMNVIVAPGKAEWDNVVITLPATAQGYEYTITALSADTIVLELDNSDQFMFELLDAGDQLNSPGSSGDSITVVGIDASRWAVKGMNGQNVSTGALVTWSDGGA